MLQLMFLCIAAFTAGFIDSIAGGGGLISLPAILATGIPSHIALGTNKLQSMCGTSFSVINYARRNKVIWKVALIGVPFSLIGSWIGTELTLIIASSTMAKVLIFMLPPAAILMMVSRSLLKKEGLEPKCTRNMYYKIALVCLLIGTYDGFFGPGTGTFFIVFLVLLCQIPLISASATSKVFNLASNVGAVVTFIASGNVYYSLGIAMAISNIAGNIVGSSLAIKRGNDLVQKFVYIAIGILFVYLLWTQYR